MNIAIEISGVTLGEITVENVKVSSTTPELFAEMDAVCERSRRELTVEGVAEIETISAVRRISKLSLSDCPSPSACTAAEALSKV